MTPNNVICGLATVPSVQHSETELYALPGGLTTSDRNQARKAAVAIDDLIKANGGVRALTRGTAA